VKPFSSMRGSLFDIRYSSFCAFIHRFLFSCSFFLRGGLLPCLPMSERSDRPHRKSDSLLWIATGQVIHELRVNAVGRRLDWTALQDISPALQDAVVQAEQGGFTITSGVDYLLRHLQPGA